MMGQLEDFMHMLTPVNVPGTSTEYRNWSRRLTGSMEELFERPAVRELCERLNRARGR